MDQPARRTGGRYAVITRLVLFLGVCAVAGGLYAAAMILAASAGGTQAATV